MEQYYDRVGRVFDIQRYSVHDGPGIRTIVFLKGCFLRCKWCCNPESQDFKIQTMEQGGKTKTVGYDISVRDLMEEIAKDRMYFQRSGGGITLSGGECLAQPEFTEALLRACHDYGFTTAIETTGFAKREIIERIIPHVDYVLMDIKHMDSAKHQEFTGRPNELILDNAKWIAQNAHSMTVRVPTVPTFNATAQEIREIAKFANTLPGVKELHLLPYHRLGTDKYTGIGRTYTLPDILPPNKETMEALVEAAKSVCDLHVQIGG